MWKLYDDLYIGIPSGILITGCVIGEKWTTVRIDGNVGLARTLEMPENPEKFAAQFVGEPLRDTGCHMRWNTLARASVGVAALNAWYNIKSRVEGLDGAQAPSELCGKTAYICSCGCEDSFPVPMSPDFDRAAYARLKEYDNVVISSDALITRALPGLLDIVGEKGNVVITGESTPATALFFAFDMPVREVRGVYPRFPDTVEACAAKNIADPAPGVLPFCVKPQKLVKLHETEAAQKAINSPYKATKFNNYFA